MKILIPLFVMLSLAACDRREAQIPDEESTTTDTVTAPATPATTDMPSATENMGTMPAAPPAVAACEGMTGQEEIDCRERERARPPTQPPETGDVKDQTTPPS